VLVLVLVLVLVGTFLLPGNLGFINVSLIALFSTWWTLILIGVGVLLFVTPSATNKSH